MAKVIKSSGNVFEDLGLPNAGEEFVRATLTARISHIIIERKLSQKEAADILGIDQPKVSALKNGRYTGFSLERLFAFIMALGKDIDVIIKPKANLRKPANIAIHSVY